MNYKQARSVLRGYDYDSGTITGALDTTYEQGSSTLPDGLLVTWDDEHGFRLHEENVRAGERRD